MSKALIKRLCAGVILSLLSSVHALADLASLEYVTQSLKLPDGEVSVRLPAGFKLELLASLKEPRLMTFADNGDLLIGSKSGKVYRLPPPYTDPQVLVYTGDYPHSVALREGELLIARSDGLYRAPYQPGDEQIDARAVSLVAPLPAGGGHSSRTVAIGPDNRVYLGLGISGNCSDEYLSDSYPFQDRRGGILVLDESGEQPQWKPFASGLRNPVGFDWHPQTGNLYAANNGPDHLGYDQPPEYFSRVTKGSFHGMPWFQFNGTGIRRDPCIDKPPPRPVDEVTAPVATFPARNAPMGVAFVPDGGLMPVLEGSAIVALHGSWGTRPAGGARGDPATRRPPGLVAVRFSNGEAQLVDDLVRGFQLPDGKRWARPVGVAIGPDGALYFTSDGGVNGLFRLAPVTSRSMDREPGERSDPR